MVVTLIGYRGSGKTSVAGPLAERLEWDWVDADDEIERRAGRPIRDIFAEQGEAGFRALERQVLAELLGRSELVIAAGGGAVGDAEIRRAMQKAGPVIWLQASADVLEQRINADPATAARRPDLTAVGGRAEIEQLLQQRAPLYERCASQTVDTNRLSIAEAVEMIYGSVAALLDEDRQP